MRNTILPAPSAPARLAAATRAAAPSAVVEAMEARRLLSAGDADPSYGIDGTARSPFPEAASFSTTAVDNRNGNTVVAGISAVTAYDDYRLGLVRFNSAGQPDTTFSGDGRLLSDILGDTRGFGTPVTDVLVQPDNKVLVSGRLRSDGAAALVRFNADGSVDTAFGQAAKYPVSHSSMTRRPRRRSANGVGNAVAPKTKSEAAAPDDPASHASPKAVTQSRNATSREGTAGLIGVRTTPCR